MARMRRRWLMAGCIALYLLVLGFFGGMATERIRFDQRRAEIIRQYDEALKRWQGHLMRLEQGDTIGQPSRAVAEARR